MTAYAIDFDDSYTTDTFLWSTFCKLAKRLGHDVYIISCRRNTQENNAIIDEVMERDGLCLPVFLTDLRAKKQHMENRGIKIDVWVDDDPRCILEGK